jgi:hypothetical protein
MVMSIILTFFHIHNFRNSPSRPILRYYWNWKTFSGFVANLTDEEASKMAGVYVDSILLEKLPINYFQIFVNYENWKCRFERGGISFSRGYILPG